MNERGLTNAVRVLLTKLVQAGAPMYFLKIHGSIYQKKNQPDWLIVIDSLAYFLETKHPDEPTEPRDSQKIEFKKWERAGADVRVFNNMNDIKLWLRNILGNAMDGEVSFALDKLLQPRK